MSLGKHVVSVQEFQDLVTRAGTLIKYKSQYIYIDVADFAQLEKELSKSSDLSNIELLSIALAEEFNESTILLSQYVKSLIKSLTSFETTDQQKGLKATFRPYQLRGYSWLVKNVKIGVGSIIADDMGLGKNLQILDVLFFYSFCIVDYLCDKLQYRLYLFRRCHFFTTVLAYLFLLEKADNQFQWIAEDSLYAYVK